MPIRLTCPSCSATLSVKDEYAGRAVKCPKCGGVIPASQPAAPSAPAPAPAAPPPAASSPPPAPAPAAAAEKSPFEELDEPAKPAKSGGKITGKPVTSKAKDEDEEDDERPRRKAKDRDEDDDERPRRKKRDEDDDDDAKSKKRDRDRDDKDEDGDEGRPKRKRRGEDDDDDGPPRGRRGKPEKKGGSNTAVILGIVAVCLLGCCGGIGYGVYYLIQKGKEGVENVQNQLSLAENFAKVKVGTTTRREAEALFGPGQPATMDELKKAYAVGGVPEGWNKMIAEGRAFMWVKGEDRVFMAFSPNGNPDSKVQRKNLAGKYVGYLSDGELDDAKFSPGKPPTGGPNKPPTGTPGKEKDEEPPAGPLTEVKAEELAQEFKDNEGDATSKYKDKWLLVEGKVLDVTTGPPTDDGAETVMLKLIGIKTPNGRGDLGVWCYVRPEESRNAWDTARGQTVKIKGKCSGGGKLQTYVGLKFCRIDNKEKDPALSATASSLIAEFAKSPETANEKYKDQEVVITGARFVSLTDGNDLVNFVGSVKGGPPIKLQANFTFGQRKRLEQLKPGQPVRFRARAGLLFGTDPNKYVSFYDAYLMP